MPQQTHTRRLPLWQDQLRGRHRTRRHSQLSRKVACRHSHYVARKPGDQNHDARPLANLYHVERVPRNDVRAWLESRGAKSPRWRNLSLHSAAGPTSDSRLRRSGSSTTATVTATATTATTAARCALGVPNGESSRTRRFAIRDGLAEPHDLLRSAA